METVVSAATKDRNEISTPDSFPSSPLVSIAGSDAGSSETPDSSDRNDQSDLARKEIEIQSSPAYLRSEEYRLLFRLPSDEVLVQDFNCAFQESILLQGHMYLFVHHICFYSNIFGFETKKAIPFHEVTCIRKAKTAAIFPNAIEILAGGKRHFFASFLSRDEAYRLIVDGWSQHSNDIKDRIDRQDSKAEIRFLDNGLITPDRNKETHLSGEHELLANGNNEKVDVSVSTGLSEVEEIGEDAEPAVTAECSTSLQSLRWNIEDADPPQVPEYYTKVAESKFPIQVEEFFNLFFSDDAVNFVESFHRRCGDKDFRCSSWYKHEQIGHARDLSFQHPIKIYFGAKSSHCQEVQKFRVYRDSHLVIETSQEVGDVPYADYFRVQGLWDVEEDVTEKNNCCLLRVYVNVAFSKKTVWKGKIETNTIEECRDAYAIWIDDAHKLLKQKTPARLEGVSSNANTIQNDDVQLEGHAEIEGPSERLDDENLLRVAQVASDSKDFSPRLEYPVHGDLSDATSTTALLRELLARFCSYMKSQHHLPLILVITSISILLLMQLSIIVLLTRAPQVHVISQVDYMNSIGSSGVEKAEAVAWLEKRIHHLKDEMLMVETRMEKMRHEHSLLKAHLKGLEQLKNNHKTE
ncbi:GRAM domain [Macleaya cordata]|uniref:GRAM domain n=1 Tax=Macleaya cordata TaxID=56857 RepID=A0A200QWY1_MACCD|nr:GRAM domain [Macleaya cordata]